MHILGLDLGHFGVKAIEIENIFSRFEIRDYREISLHGDETPWDGARTLFKSLGKVPDRVVISLPAQDITYRNLHLPTQDRKAIRTGAQFELEDDLPFALEDILYETAMVHQGKTHTELHANIVLKHTLDAFLQKALASSIDPDVITTPIWTFYQLFQNLFPLEKNNIPSLLIHLGHTSTILYSHYWFQPIYFKHLNLGMKQVTQKLSSPIESLSLLSPQEETQAPLEEVQLSQTLLQELEPFIKEIKQALFTIRKKSEQNQARIFLSGRPALLKGLPEALEAIFSLPCQRLYPLQQLTEGRVSYSEETEVSQAFALGLALTLTKKNRHLLINFRQGDFSKMKNLAAIFKTFQKPVLAFLAILGTFFLTQSIQSFWIQSKMDPLENRIKVKMHSVFGYISPSATQTYLENPELLVKKLKTLLKRKTTLARIPRHGKKSPLWTLKTLSQTIPHSIIVDLIEFKSTTIKNSKGKAQKKLNLSFLTKEPQAIAAVEKHLHRFISFLKKTPPKKALSLDKKDKRYLVTFSGIEKEQK